MPEHLGYRAWATDNATHPYPISPIKLHQGARDWISGAVTIAIPPAIPAKKVFAERGVGINLIGKLAFAMRFDEQPNGAIKMEAHMTTEHGFFWPEHGETGPGQEHTFIIPHAKLQAGGTMEALLPHGKHTDCAVVWWLKNPNSIYLNLSVAHYHSTVQQLLDMRKHAEEESKKKPKFKLPTPVIPKMEDKDGDEPKPAPKPKPTPTPSADASKGISSALAGVLEKIAAWLRRI